MNKERMEKLFRVDNPVRYANIDLPIPIWKEGEPDWQSHLEGTTGLCITPIGRDSTCYWGALDIDSKGDAPAVNHQWLVEFVEAHRLPLNIYKSKSGKGAHAYLFSPKPVPAPEIRGILRLYSLILRPYLDESNGIEVFPKQDKLVGDDNGSCIRPPYFGNKCQPAFEGEPIVRPVISIPPCLVALPDEGDRNNYVYHVTNFLMLSDIINVKPLVHTVNGSLDEPLLVQEVDRTVASAQRQRSRKGMGFGLGCTSCPDSKKATCKFSSQLKIRSTSDLMTVQIVHYIADDPKIRLIVEGKSLVFDTEEAFNNHAVRLGFITKHRTSVVPMMKKGEWNSMMHSLLEEAEHIEDITHRDKGHAIIQKIKKWSKDFKNGVNRMFSGTPCFISETEVLIFPHDVYTWFINTGVMGITREDINTTLESIGTPIIMQGFPAIKIPAKVLEVKSPGLEIPIVSNIDPEELLVEAGSDGTAIFKNKEGVQISLTNSYIKDHPEIMARMVEVTKTSINIGF